MEKFTTIIKEVEVWKFREHLLGEHTIADIEIENVDCKVHWEAYFDMPGNCISSIDFVTTNIECSFDWSFVEDSLTHEETDLILSKGGVVDGENIVGSFKLNFSDWDVSTDFEIDNRGYAAPYTIELDFAKKLITVQ